ncbi:LPS-assembly protein LptD [Paraburkholderia phenoliruptrix]|uniref:LPS-assembly protein LptD n=1 Tax=Paraburkholderia phenoliruptrix TaxID=252970 RepID=UPI001C6F01EA|nr:LPS-assembly protein LptD [Paraburkholderia phenoliruptrix]MBW9104286.1 LPS-assembly protein LptD [Paraburkholderia phenoliruptrix]MBW9128505.1 LPS-assembly protein LptD [Paraburkholderia ginsengiterrae]
MLCTAGCAPLAAYAQLSGSAAAPESVDGVWGLRLAPQLTEQPLRGSARPTVWAIADSLTTTADTDVSLKGHAQLRRDVSIVKGDALHYDVDTDKADAYGNVQLVQNGNVFDGPDAHVFVGANEGFISVPKYRFHLTGGWGSAQRIDLLDKERTVVRHGTYSTCQCEAEPAWYVKASEFEMDSGNDEGIAHNGVLFFQGVPLLASPWLSFPLSGARRSGLLPPTFSMSSTNGVDVALPYYFNLAPNYDFTLTPRIMTRRGAMLTADYRYLRPNDSGTISIAWLQHDAITNTRRYSIALNQHWNLGSGFGAYVDYNRVSDSTVVTDLASGVAFPTGSTTLYQQEAGLTYSNGPWSVLAREQRWQSFSSDSTYNREPQVNVRYARYNVGGFDFGAEADATRFTISSSDMTQGNRFVFNPYVSYPIERPGWFITPKLAWHFAAYDLTSIGTDVPAGEPKSFSVSVPTFSLDSGMRFERSVRLFGNTYIQTLEPRLFYVYTPYRNQAYVPLFDTAAADFGLTELFMANSFVGNDRVSDSNRATAALTTRFIDPASGDERARFVLAQQYDFRTPRVTLQADDSISTVARTGIIAGASYKVGPNLSAEQAVEYSQANHYLTHAEAGLGWAPGAHQVLNMAYRYTRANSTLDYQPVNQFIVSGQWPLARNVVSVARVNYDMSSHRLIAGLLGLQYEANCWSLGVAFEKYTNATSSTTSPSTGTRVLMQLQLKGFSQVDNGLLNQFRASVPGYTPTSTVEAPTSRFSDYP